jgi:hypothetical protein
MKEPRDLGSKGGCRIKKEWETLEKAKWGFGYCCEPTALIHYSTVLRKCEVKLIA